MIIPLSIWSTGLNTKYTVAGDNREYNNREDNNREVKTAKQKPRSNNREVKTEKQKPRSNNRELLTENTYLLLDNFSRYYHW